MKKNPISAVGMINRLQCVFDRYITRLFSLNMLNIEKSWFELHQATLFVDDFFLFGLLHCSIGLKHFNGFGPYKSFASIFFIKRLINQEKRVRRMTFTMGCLRGFANPESILLVVDYQSGWGCIISPVVSTIVMT